MGFACLYTDKHFMNSSPDNRHFLCEKKVKKVLAFTINKVKAKQKLRPDIDFNFILMIYLSLEKC